MAIQALREGNPLDFDLTDLDDALNKVKCNKASGKDDVQGEFLKLFPLNDKTALLRLLNQRFKGVVKKPESWYSSYCSLLPKKKGAVLIKSFRPIAVSSVIQRLYDRMLLVKLTPLVPDFTVSQFANRKGFQAAEPISALRRIVEKSFLWQRVWQCSSWTLKRLFDRITHKSIMYMLMWRKVPAQLIVAILVEYVNAELEIHLDNRSMAIVVLLRGVKQGSPLSALLPLPCGNKLTLECTLIRKNLQMR